MKDPTLNSDINLFSCVAQGDKAAFRSLYELYRQKIYSLAYSITHSEILAEEITQEIFIKIWEYGSKLQDIREFDAWLRIIVRNLCYTYISRLSKEKLAIKDIYKYKQESANITEEVIYLEEFKKQFIKALNKLPEQQKKVYLLSRCENIKYEDIAKQMGISINTVKTHMKAALKKIRFFIGEELSVFLLISILQ